jgi:hypothetical protein
LNDTTISAGDDFDAVTARSSVDYMLRTTQQAQMQMAMLADQKASVVMSVAFVLLSVSAGTLSGDSLSPVLLTVVVTSGLSAAFALLALLPSRSVNGARADGGGINPLFFGSFRQLDLTGYERHMAMLMSSDAAVYRTISRDIYFSGAVLRRKYRLLRYSYLALLAGLIGSLAMAASWLALTGSVL